MRRLPILSTPPRIVIADEPVGDPGTQEALGPGRVDGFELVPAWQARAPRRLPRVCAAATLVAVVLVAAMWVRHDDDARAVRERPVATREPRPRQARAVVVGAVTPDHRGVLRVQR